MISRIQDSVGSFGPEFNFSSIFWINANSIAKYIFHRNCCHIQGIINATIKFSTLLEVEYSWNSVDSARKLPMETNKAPRILTVKQNMNITALFEQEMDLSRERSGKEVHTLQLIMQILQAKEALKSRDERFQSCPLCIVNCSM